ncbi:MAG: hypothetical protein ABEJ03_03670 [Candidatus Nanohaloarchaea archaeon]
MDVEDIREKLVYRDLGHLEIALISLVFVTATIHLYVGLTTGSRMLLLAALGFYAGKLLFTLLPEYRQVLAALVVPYTGYQMLRYYQFYGLEIGPLAGLDKLVQLVLILLAGEYIRRNSDLGLMG